jgi:hypothetical protein
VGKDLVITHRNASLTHRDVWEQTEETYAITMRGTDLMSTTGRVSFAGKK